MDDLISRSDAIDAVKEERFPIDSDYAEGFMAALDKVEWILKEWLPSAQPEPCEDTISRQDAIRVASGFCHPANIAKELAKLPSAQPDLDEVYAHAETEAEFRYHAEIVRCKDCKHQVKEWRDDKRLKDKGYWAYGCKVISEICDYWALLGQDDDYCSYAERKEQNVENS